MYEIDEYTVALLHFEDGLKDESGKVWTAQNGAALTAAQRKFGEGALYVNGEAYVTTPYSLDFSFNTEDGTIDLWVYPTATPTANYELMDMRSSITASDFALGITPALKLYFYDLNDTLYLSSNEVVMNKWNHVALIKYGSNIILAVNGICTTVLTNKKSLLASNIVVGSWVDHTSSHSFIGYIDEFRISKGIARWTSDFDPEALPQAPSNYGLLRITMNDSSEREYKLSVSEIDDFVKWFNRTIGTGTTGYVFNKAVQNSKEYLSFEKIISFEVIPLTE
jgi:hypothetical protein